MNSFDSIKSKEEILGIINSKEFENFFNALNTKEFSALFDVALDKMPTSNDEIWGELVSYYFTLLHLLKIDNFNSFSFPDYEDCRTVVVDGIEYDFDSEFCHDDSEATNALCAIDCLMADLEEDNLEEILKILEKKINVQGQ